MLQLSKVFLARLLLGALIVFALYSNVRLIIRNNKLNERLQAFQKELKEKEARNQKLTLLISYYQTPSYQDSEARRRLALKSPDETVMQVSGVDYNKDSSTLEDSIYKNTEPTLPTPPTNFSRWRSYLFK